MVPRQAAQTAERQAAVASTDQSASSAPPAAPGPVQYASAAPRIALPHAEPTPAKGEAYVELNGRSLKPENHAGQFQRVAVRLNQRVPVRLSWPDDTTSPDVFVQAVHGGKIDGAGNNKRFPLGSDKSIAFTFTPDSAEGSYQIVLRRGTTEEALQFWVPTANPKNDPPTLN